MAETGTPPAEPLVRIRDLRYRYAGSGVDVLRIPFLDIRGNGLTALTGASGAGKSTLVELIAGTLQDPYEGSVQVLGREWRELRRDADRQRLLRRIGLIPQDFGLLPTRTPRETILQDLADAGVPGRERNQRAERSLGQVKLNDFADRRVGQLSGGQRQRVAIARMLARDVELVVADEPTANLDPNLVGEVVGLLRQIATRAPVLVVTHDPQVADLCDRTIVLQSLASGDPTLMPVSATSGSARRKRAAIVGVTAAVLVAAGAGIVLASQPTQHGPAKLAPSRSLAPAPRTGRAQSALRPTRTKDRSLANQPASPVLGSATAWQNGAGFGRVEPDEVYFGGDETGKFEQLTWSGWGSPTAVAKGYGYAPPLGAPNSASVQRPVRLVASERGTCHGRAAYLQLSVTIYVPQPEAAPPVNACTGPSTTPTSATSTTSIGGNDTNGTYTTTTTQQSAPPSGNYCPPGTPPSKAPTFPSGDPCLLRP